MTQPVPQRTAPKGLLVRGFDGLRTGVLPLALLVGISALEMLVCAIQAYVFAILTSVYLNDAVNLH